MPTGSDFRSYIQRYLCPTKTSSFENFDDFIACDLWFRPPPIKNSGYAYEIGDRPKNFFEDLSFLRTLVAVFLALGLGLEHSCPWPRKGLSSEMLSLASNFFVSLALVSSLVSSSSPLVSRTRCPYNFCAGNNPSFREELLRYWSNDRVRRASSVVDCFGASTSYFFHGLHSCFRFSVES